MGCCFFGKNHDYIKLQVGAKQVGKAGQDGDGKLKKKGNLGEKKLISSY